jgi:hypothetical protein
MPADFPLAAYNDIHAHIAPLQPRFPDAYRHYGGAWNAVAIRFRSTAEADDVFQLSLNDPSSVEQRFRQEVALFQFFTNSVSVLDSCAYALHALGNVTDAAAFLLTGQSLTTAHFRGVANSFEERFPSTHSTSRSCLQTLTPFATLRLVVRCVNGGTKSACSLGDWPLGGIVACSRYSDR